MNVILWLEQPDLQKPHYFAPVIEPSKDSNLYTLQYALYVLERQGETINFVGVYSPLDTQGGGNKGLILNGKPVPYVDKDAFTTLDYDLVLVSRYKIPVQTIFNDTKAIGIQSSKVLIDKSLVSTGFTLEKFRRLQRSRLSIISMGGWGDKLNEQIGMLPSAPGVSAPISDKEFLKFLRNPSQNLNKELRAKINWYNIILIMQTDDPKALEEFNRLPYGKKICFVPFDSDLDSAVTLWTDEIEYDIWELLLYGRKMHMNGPWVRPGSGRYVTSDGKLNYYNWWGAGKNHADDFWVSKLIHKFVGRKKNFNMFSVYGDHRLVRQMKAERKIFVACEELESRPSYRHYKDYCLKYVDLALGMAHIDAPNYLQMPWGVLDLFDYETDMWKVEERIDELNAARSTCKYECVLINSHDLWNTRAPICNLLRGVLDIKYAGNWNHNTDELKNDYGNDKRKYVHEFRFNICSENTNQFGYVTEKIFDAFRAGAIPIYYGSDNRPEPGIINPSAVLFFDPKSDNEALVKEVVRLKTDQEYYDKFMRQEKLFPKATAEYVYASWEKLAKKLRELD